MTADEASRYDLVIVGGNSGGLSVAISSLRSGIENVRVIEPGHEVAFPELVAENELDIGWGETVHAVDADGDDLIVRTDHHTYRSTGVLMAERVTDPQWRPPIPVAETDRVHVDSLPELLREQDLLVVGFTDHTVELVAKAAHGGANVVVAAGGMDPAMLSPAGANMLRRLERERRATILYRAVPTQIDEIDGLPMVYFGDRRTPNLEFDHVIFASRRYQPDAIASRMTPAALETGRVVFFGRPGEEVPGPCGHGFELGKVVAAAVFPALELVPEPSEVLRRARHAGAVEELRAEHYNATITRFEPTHSDLWVLRVRPDHGDVSHLAGQYASLGLGFWENRVDDAVDAHLERRWTKLIRRSYSISHPIFDDQGYLARQWQRDELEFYIVLVPPTSDRVPALTPRLALKRPGDRIYLGPKVAGRYTLHAVTDPESTVVFLATGTGEAPHNAMVVDLLQRGHSGPIVSAVTVRRSADLGYLDKHRRLEARFANYTYVPLPTREPDVPKRYVQDLVRSGDLGRAVGGVLEPESTHVYLCGNPAMIGLPEAEGGVETYPKPTGVVELLVEQGFTLDRRGTPGNIHFEEYW